MLSQLPLTQVGLTGWDGWDGRAPNPRDVLQPRSSQAAGKHGVGLLEGLMRQAGQSGVFTIFILTCAPVHTACSQSTFQLPLLYPFTCLSPALCFQQGHHLLANPGGYCGNPSPLSPAPGLSVQVPPRQPFECPTGP